ncbi:MAG: outer membrane beta-barrel protein [Pseudomonadota bacterium]
MPRCLVYALPFALAALSPEVSFAAGEDCPDGWFCEPSAAPQPSAPSERPAPAPPLGSRPPGPSMPPTSGAAPGYPPPGYAPAPPGYPPPGYPPPGYPPSPGPPNQTVLSLQVPPDNPPPKRRRNRFHEWGFNLHLEGALLDNDPRHEENTWMGGLGFAFRYRPLPPLAFEAGVDLLSSGDHQGYTRSEAAFLLNTLLFFNPHDVVQIYALGGLGFSGANVTIAPRSGDSSFKRYEDHYSYFGGQLGLGVEVRVSRRVAIGGDLTGFIRGRTDDRWDDRPEYIDSTGQRASDSSGGGLLRAGVTFYW